MPIDPFSLKGMSKWNPKRFSYTLFFRLHDLWARLRFETYKLPYTVPENGTAWDPALEPRKGGDTAVTEEQTLVLAECLRLTAYLQEPVVEVGSYHGVTTSFLARNAKRTVVAVDPFFGWGGSEADYRKFLVNIKELPSVKHIRMTSGQAASKISNTSFIFIDADHDYANVSFDLATYAPKVVHRGIIALHDTDNIRFAGTRRAVYRFLEHSQETFELLFHVHDLTVIRKLQAP